MQRNAAPYAAISDRRATPTRWCAPPRSPRQRSSTWRFSFQPKDSRRTVNGSHELRRGVEREKVPRVRDDVQPSARDRPRVGVALLCPGPIAIAVDHQDRHADLFVLGWRALPARPFTNESGKRARVTRPLPGHVELA